MGSTEATYDGLRMPETMEPCWRCSAPEPLHVVKRQTLSAKHTASGEPEPQPDAHFYVCSHCGYQVPEPGRVGFVMKELAALRWNGEMLAKRMKQAEARQAAILAGSPVSAFGTQLRSRTTADADGD